jgi:hypothetical protein
MGVELPPKALCIQHLPQTVDSVLYNIRITWQVGGLATFLNTMINIHNTRQCKHNTTI